MDIRDYIQSNYKTIQNIKEDASVVLAESNIDRKRYVIKHKNAYDSSIYKRLKDEASDIDGIPKIYEILEDADGLWVIEEYIEGRTLDAYFSSSKSAWMIENVIANICRTLQKLHNMNPPIIHRDIKPSNIIVTYEGDIKLIDFNISRAYTGEADKDTVSMGTKGYASPEQYGFKESDARSDLYSLGATINEIMDITKCYTPKLKGFVEKAMEFDPDKRFQDTVEVFYYLKHYEEISELNEHDNAANQKNNERTSEQSNLYKSNEPYYYTESPYNKFESEMTTNEYIELEKLRLKTEREKSNNATALYIFVAMAIFLVLVGAILAAAN